MAAVAEVTQHCAGKQARATNAGIAMNRNMSAASKALCDVVRKCSEWRRVGQMHVADGMGEIGEAEGSAGVGLFGEANFGRLGGFEH